jgi:HSP20 family protein
MIRWEPVGELHTIQNEMNRLFNTLFDSPSEGPRGNPGVRRWIPAMDLVESGDAYVLRADLPGLAESDVNIELEDNVLTISGERKTDAESRGEGYYRIERGFGTFSRSLTLPEGVDPDSVQARFERGVLEVMVPKPAQRKPRKVAISVGDSGPATIEGMETSPADSVNAGDPVAAGQ